MPGVQTAFSPSVPQKAHSGSARVAPMRISRRFSAAPVHGVGHVEPAGGEAAQVFADLLCR